VVFALYSERDGTESEANNARIRDEIQWISTKAAVIIAVLPRAICPIPRKKPVPVKQEDSAIDASLAESELGYKPVEDFDSGFQLTLSWMLSNEAWWRAVMDGSYREWISKNYSDG
jgi:nucleoside-diphosphate-sugar epimerase